MARGFAELCNPSSNPRGIAHGTIRRASGLRASAIGQADIAVAASIEDAVRGADIVATITTASAPLVDPSWIKPGALAAVDGRRSEIRAQELSGGNASLR